MKKIFVFLCLIILKKEITAQLFLNDSALRTLDYKAMDSSGLYDSIDIVEGDYYDTLDYTGMVNAISLWNDDQWAKYWCRKADHIKMDRDVDLRKNNWNYILVFYDDFESLNKEFWQKPEHPWLSQASKWNNFIDWGRFCEKYENGEIVSELSKNQSLFLDNNASIFDGNLRITTKYQPTEVKWDYTNNVIDNNSSNTKVINYTSGRVESAWAFDGSFDYETGVDDDGNPIAKMTREENPLLFISKIKHPNDKPTLPAFWLVGFTEPYEELDIFEYFNRDGNSADEMNSTMHSGFGSPGGGYECKDKKLIQNQADYHIYSFFWNQFDVTTYLDDKKILQRHQFSRNNRIGSWPRNLVDDETYRIRNPKYNRRPMRINFSTNVFCGSDNVNLNDRMDIDYIAVYKKFPCAKDEIFDDLTDLELENRIYNVKIAKKATFNFNINTGTAIPADEMFKILATDIVDVNSMTVDPYATFILEQVENRDLCSNEAPQKVGESAPLPQHLIEVKTKPEQMIETKIESERIVTWSRDNVFYVINSELISEAGIYTIDGRLVQKSDGLNNNGYLSFDCSNLFSGCYVLLVWDKNKKLISTRKILIAN